MMKKTFSGDLVSYQNQRNVLDQIKKGIPITFSLCIGAGIIWFLLGVVFGYLSAIRAGRATDRALTILALIGISLPVFFLGRDAPLLRRLQGAGCSRSATTSSSPTTRCSGRTT